MKWGQLVPFPLNKPAVPDRRLPACFLVSFGQRGAGFEVRLQLILQIWCAARAATWYSSSVACRRRTAVPLPTLADQRPSGGVALRCRPLPTSSPLCQKGGRSGFVDAAFRGGFVRSGHVPGGDSAGRAVKLFVGDLERRPWSRLRSPYAVQGHFHEMQGCACNFLLFVGSCVICTVTAHD